jgi:glucose-6-phosphate 1-dehydrogenase
MTEVTVKSLIGEDKINSFCDHFAYLKHRWDDEREYENFEEYKKNCENIMGHPVIKMTKRPFKVVFDIKGHKCYFHYRHGSIGYGQTL